MEIVLENNRAASTVFILLTFVCLTVAAPPADRPKQTNSRNAQRQQTMKSYFGAKCLCDKPKPATAATEQRHEMETQQSRQPLTARPTRPQPCPQARAAPSHFLSA